MNSHAQESSSPVVRRVAVVLLLASVGPIIAQESLRQVASPEEAIELAEAFIVQQGYTDIPGDPEALQRELFGSDDPRDGRVILAERRGTTSPNAYAYLKDDFTGWFQWWVYFEYLRRDTGQCPTLFRVVHLWQPERDSERGLLVVSDIIRDLQPDAVLVGEGSVECSLTTSEQ